MAILRGILGLCIGIAGWALAPQNARAQEDGDAAESVLIGERLDGYRGIWYANQATDDEYVYKYSGGLGTYCAKHIPMAVHAPVARKTFFVYGGVTEDGSLAEMVSFYDHETGTVPRPVILMDKKTTDAHDNPVLSIDGDGYLWVFASSHGTARPSYIFKSKEPYSIDAFEQVLKTNFSYPQPWYIDGKGFFFLQTYYEGGRGLYWSTSEDGRNWTERQLLAHMDAGHYQISWPGDGFVASTFNYHPAGKGLNFRTNLYYMETPDMGRSWRTVSGDPLAPPLKSPDSKALVHDYQAEGWKVYMKDLNYDPEGRPIILHLVSRGWQPGPDNGPRTWRVAHWTGEQWALHDITDSDNNYDAGSVHVMEDGSWMVIGPTATGPQAYNPGGEIEVWKSVDQGAHWERVVQLTAGSEYNHTYARRPLQAHPGFQSFWADGHGRKKSESRLYFWNALENAVFQLPAQMEGDQAEPARVYETVARVE